jgi:hypothetical protein
MRLQTDLSCKTERRITDTTGDEKRDESVAGHTAILSWIRWERI